MNLQEQISRIQSMMGVINESKLLPLETRRRLSFFIDKAYKNNLKFVPSKYFSNKQDYYKEVIDLTLRDLHGDLFVYNNLSDEEWEEYKKFIISYIKSNYKI